MASNIHITYPQIDFQLRAHAGKQEIWDAVRKKWVRLTPEEWVRQNFIQYLKMDLKYPAVLFSIEKEILLGELRKRCDVVVFKDANPWMIVECKETNVPLTEKVLMQILRYNMSVPVPFLVITNGNETYAWQRKDDQMIALDVLPRWK